MTSAMANAIVHCGVSEVLQSADYRSMARFLSVPCGQEQPRYCFSLQRAHASFRRTLSMERAYYIVHVGEDALITDQRICVEVLKIT